MVNVVVIVTMVSDYLVKTALQGQPSLIDFCLGYLSYASLTASINSSLFLGAASLKLCMALKKPKSNRLTSGELADCV